VTPALAVASSSLAGRAVEELGALDEFLAALGERLRSHLPGIVLGVALLLLFWLLARASGRVLRKLFARAETDPALAQLALPLARLAILALGLLVAVDQMGFNVGSLLAGVGIAGLAVGLAAQETLANLLAGIALLWDRPFRLGDAVTIGGRFGTVTEIGVRSTRLRTLEQMEVTIPNKEVAQGEIVNHSRYPEIRIHVPFAIGYREDPKRVRRALLDAVAGNPVVLAEPAPQVVVTALADSGVALELRLWVKTPVAESATLFHFLELVKATLDAAGVEIPFPQRTLHLPGAVRVAAAGGAG
jgi:small conductance mechanosensitive channel